METFIGCSAIIHDSDRRVLIAQRSKNKKQFPLLWETVGGALEVDETPEECIRREVKEEIGCELLDLRLFRVYIVRDNDKQHILIVYTGRISEDINVNYEIEDIKWVRKNDIDKYTFYSNNCRQKLLDFYDEFY